MCGEATQNIHMAIPPTMDKDDVEELIREYTGVGAGVGVGVLGVA